MRCSKASRPVGVFAEELLHGGAEAEPSRQRYPALSPGETPGNGAQILDALVRLAGGRARADVEVGNLLDGRGGEEVVREPRRLVDHLAIGGHARHRQLGRCLQKGGVGLGLGREQARFQACGHERFEVATADFRVGVFGGNDLALLGQSDLPVHGARRLGENGLVARASAAPHRAAAPVEEAQGDAIEGSEHPGQRRGGAVKLPGAGEEPPVLVAVGIAQHDVLLAARAPDQPGNAGRSA